MSVTKIVITGGPCAGKTTGLNWIQNAFTARGFTVLIVPETATELISGGVAPWTCGTNLDYQKSQMQLQLVKEQVFMRAAESMPNDRILLVCDRGAMDNRAYMNQDEWNKTLEAVGANEVELRDSYDAVFHLVTAAKGAEMFYTTENNTARTETPEQAVQLDNKMIAAWTGHPHLRVIDNTLDFDQKMHRLISEIASFVGEPQPYQSQRKFLIEYPDISRLEKMDNCCRIEIIQTFLRGGNDGEDRRIRQRGIDGHYTYYLTIKRTVSGDKHIEIERRLTQREYLMLLMDADPAMHPIRKDRYCLANGGQYFEIDVYPEWTDRAIMKIKLTEKEDEIRFPDEIKVIREVTHENAYRNSYIARMGLTY